MYIYTVFIERDCIQEKPSFDIPFFLERLNKDEREATAAGPPASGGALVQTTEPMRVHAPCSPSPAATSAAGL